MIRIMTIYTVGIDTIKAAHSIQFPKYTLTLFTAGKKQPTASSVSTQSTLPLSVPSDEQPTTHLLLESERVGGRKRRREVGNEGEVDSKRGRVQQSTASIVSTPSTLQLAPLDEHPTAHALGSIGLQDDGCIILFHLCCGLHNTSL